MTEEIKNTGLITIDPAKFGMDPKKADEIAEAFREPLAIMAELETEFEEFKNLVGEPSKETCEKAKALKLKYVKARTGTAAIHKDQKKFYLDAGRYVDAWKNRQLEIGKEREDKLYSISDYYEIKEAERIENLQTERAAEIMKYQDEGLAVPGNLGEMAPETWEVFLSGMKAQHEAREAEKAREAKERERHMEIINAGMRTAHESGFYFVYYLSVLAEDVYSMPDDDFSGLLEAIEKEIKAFEAEQEKQAAEAERLEKENEKLNKKVKAVKVKKREEKKSLKSGHDLEKVKAYFELLKAVQKPVISDPDTSEIFTNFRRDVATLMNKALDLINGLE